MTAVQKVISLYKGRGFSSLFARIRFWDAPYLEVEQIVPKNGFIVDLGCGEGIFTNFLGLSSKSRKILGIEIDRKRLRVANRGVSNVSFKWGDATKVRIPPADAIVLFHLLHHLRSFAEQEKVINMCFNQLKRAGKLIVVEAEPKISFKFLVTWLTDHLLVPWLFERKLYSSIFFRRSQDWMRLLEESGFSCNTISAEEGKPFTHIILECQRK